MPVTVGLPNGKTVQFPDGMSPQDMQSAIESSPELSLPAGATGPLPGMPPLRVPAGLQGPPQGGNAIQRTADNLTRIEPHSADAGVVGNAITAAGNVGAGFLSPLSMAAHPLQTIKGIASMMPGSINVADPDSAPAQMIRLGMNNPAGAAESLVGQAGLGAGLGLTGEAVVPKVASGLKSFAPKVANASLGAVSDPVSGNPGMAVSQQGITGFTPQSILAKTKIAIPEVAAEHSGVLADYKGAPIDIGNAVSAPFDSTRALKTDPTTGAAMPTQLTKLNKVQTYLTHEPDSFTGQPTTALRPLNQMTPLEANQLKSSIYGMTDYDNPFRSSLANNASKQTAYNIKNRILDAVPESADSGEQLHNLMSLKDLMESKGPTGIPTSKSGLIDNLIRKGGTSTAGSLYRLGTRLPSITDLLPGVPLAFPPARGVS